MAALWIQPGPLSAFSIIMLTQSVMHYFSVDYTLTTKHISVSRPGGGLSIHLGKVQSVSWSSGLLWGDVVVTSGSVFGNVTLRGIDAPASHAKRIIQAASDYLN